jgi:hypothetical protein
MQKLIITIVGILLITLGASAQEKVIVDKIIGVVGDNIIMLSDIESQ